MDIVAESDIPDIRNRASIHSVHGSCMIIPREDDKVRLYIQLSETDVEKDNDTGRVDKSKLQAQDLIKTVKKIFRPYYLEQVGEIDWWTIYVSE